MSDEPRRLGSRLVDLCIGVLLAAMALYGAVAIVRAIWLPLTIGVCLLAILAGIGWLFVVRFRRY